MKISEEKAIQLHISGLNCAQAVGSSYVEELKFDNELATNLACADKQTGLK